MKAFHLIFYVAVLVAVCIALSCNSTQTQKEPQKLETFTGKYRSVRGIKNMLSCYCSNAGYLTLKNGDKIALCFDELNVDEEIECNGQLTVKGVFKTKTNNPEPASPCPEGTKKILYIKIYYCQ